MPMTISTPDPIRKSCMFIRDFQSEHLKKLAKNRLQELRRDDPEAKLATIQLEVARPQVRQSGLRAGATSFDCRLTYLVDDPVAVLSPSDCHSIQVAAAVSH